MVPGSPFGPNLCALVVYLRFTQGIAFERLARLLSDLLGLSISEARWSTSWTTPVTPSHARPAAFRARLMSGTVLQPDCGSVNGTGDCGCSTVPP
jgi:hypothetical protein